MKSNPGFLRCYKPSVVFLRGIFSENVISKFLKIERKLQKYLSSKLNYTYYSYIVLFLKSKFRLTKSIQAENTDFIGV